MQTLPGAAARMEADGTSKILLQDLGGSLRLSFSLRVICGGEATVDAQNPKSFSPEVGDKLGTAVRDDAFWEAMEAENMVHTEPSGGG